MVAGGEGYGHHQWEYPKTQPPPSNPWHGRSGFVCHIDSSFPRLFSVVLLAVLKKGVYAARSLEGFSLFFFPLPLSARVQSRCLSQVSENCRLPFLFSCVPVCFLVT